VDLVVTVGKGVLENGGWRSERAMP
jgi:hypothetical protein